MPIYDYKCDDCLKYTQVERKISQYDVPPDNGCEHCKSKNVVRVIREWSAHQTQLVHGGKAPWFAESYYGPRGIPTGK